MKSLSLFSLLIIITSCSNKIPVYPPYDSQKIPASPRYESFDSWAAHPAKEDVSDLVPGKNYFTKQNPLPEVDVFFLHPTIYAKEHHPEWPWQGNVYDEALNEKVDHSTIKFQASVFNGSARVYAPRYRQAHLDVYTMKNDSIKNKALDLAYTDAREAFLYYLDHYNNGRPFIIASHSQGTMHAARLIKEFIDGKKLSEQLIAAYLVGIALNKDLFTTIQPCTNSSETGCWISWNTYERDYYPPLYEQYYKTALSTNPLTWKTDSSYAPATLNQSSVLRKFKKIYTHLSDAQNHEGLLWIRKPKFFGSAFYRSKRYHIADYNLFYGNIRSNVMERVDAYLTRSEKP
jgi:hypothetical protein